MLSDVCADWLAGAISFSDMVEQAKAYAAPEFEYGVGLAAFLRLSSKHMLTGNHAAELRALAKAIVLYHDTPPGHALEGARRQEMERLAAAALAATVNLERELDAVRAQAKALIDSIHAACVKE